MRSSPFDHLDNLYVPLTVTFPQGYCCPIPSREMVLVIPPGQSFENCMIRDEYEQADGSTIYMVVLYWLGTPVALRATSHVIQVQKRSAQISWDWMSG